jgi:GTPase
LVNFIDRHEGGERAVLVNVDLPDSVKFDVLPEFKELVRAADLQILDLMQTKRLKPSVRSFIGKGKLEDLVAMVKMHSADVVIFNHKLSPAQSRNLEEECCCKVIDRTELILDIFAQRARSFSGKLQVELAQLQHLSTRLIRGWTHLERQKGGIGLRGPGETQLEVDRRLLAKRIKAIKQRLAKIETQREQGRRRRKRNSVPTIALVGYTNAGKSTLFNQLTDSDVYAEDKLFATLDPTYRHINLAGIGEAVLVDTVGFIRDLPHELIEAFHATLQEASEADMLCHVVDVTNPEREQTKSEVRDVLEQIGAAQIPELLVYNKIDLLSDTPPRVDHDESGDACRVWVSAVTSDGCDLLRDVFVERLDSLFIEKDIVLLPAQGKLRAKLYAQNLIVTEQQNDDGSIALKLHIPKSMAGALDELIKS